MAMDDAELLARCEALVPVLRDNAGDGEQQRRVPEATLQAVHDADVFPALVPTSLGGHGLGVDAVANGTRILAHGCPAQAWTISFLILHGWLLARLPQAGRDEVFADGPVALTPAPLAPTGQVERTDHGFVVTGRWEWATGVVHADWVMVHALDVADFSSHFVVLPIDEVVVDDDWFTSGMRATGSRTVRVEGVFVPAHRTIPAVDLLGGVGEVPGDGMAGIPVAPVLGLVAAAPALGAVEAVVELYRERLATRVLAYSLGDKAAEQPAAQVRLATAISDLASARARWDAALVALVAETGHVDEQRRVDSRLAAAATVRAARRIVADVGEGAGASVYRSQHPFQRFQRDVETLKGHVLFDWDRTAELAGRHALGFELRPTDLV